MQDRIHRPGADLIAVALQFLNDRQAVDRTLLGVVQNVEADHTAEQVSVDHDVVSKDRGRRDAAAGNASRILCSGMKLSRLAATARLICGKPRACWRTPITNFVNTQGNQSFQTLFTGRT